LKIVGFEKYMTYHQIVQNDIEEILGCNIDWQLLRGKTVLITGANGDIAAYIVYTLIMLNIKYRYNIQILGVVRNKERAIARFYNILDRVDFTLLVQDVCDPININIPVDYIIHAASNTSSDSFLNQPVDTLNGNVKGTINLLDFALHKRILAFIYVSSQLVYGNGWKKELSNEKSFAGIDCADIHACYNESKRAGEMYCMAYHIQYQLPVIIARLPSVLVPSLYAKNDHHLEEFAQLTAKNSDIILKGSGQLLRTYMPINDVVSGIFLAMFKGVRGQAYNVAHSNCVLSILEMARLFVRLGDSSCKVVIGTDHVQEQEDHHFCVDGSKLMAIGWKPGCDIEHAVRYMIEAVRDA
jgi:nucleoside-diphosphate-sugar epimerase